MLWLIGFTDGEGTFSVEINKKEDMKMGYQIQISFIITQHSCDINLLNKIKLRSEGSERNQIEEKMVEMYYNTV